MKKLILLFVLIPFMGLAQNKGTHFEHGLSWLQVKEKAKNEKKYLLVDCFTTWCGPCKYMTNSIFPQEKVGTFFNENFVNVKVQFDQTKTDSEEVKSWYATVELMKKEYKVQAYPTFLIFSPEGELVHRIVGRSDADAFIDRARKAFNPETQYHTLLKKQESGNSSPETLRQLAVLAKEAYDKENAARLAKAYLETQTDLYTNENLAFLGKFTQSSKDKGFEMILNEPQKIDAVLGKGKATEIISAIVLQEEINPYLKGAPANLDSLIVVAKSKYPTVDFSRSTDFVQVQYYQKTKNWNKFQPAILTYMKKWGDEVTPGLLSSYAWAVLVNCDDPKCVAAAVTWIKRNVDETKGKDFGVLDIYANLLYKMGNKEEAIIMQQKVVDLVPAQEKIKFQAVLEKMKKGEKI